MIKLLLSSCRRYSSNTLAEILSTMPKNTKHVKEQAGIKLKQRDQNGTAPGFVYLQVLGSGARGTSSSIYLFSDQSRYMFNCGEGTQRLAQEIRTKLGRMEHIFLTRNSWEHFGGVPGLCLTLQDMGVPNLQLHGPPGIGEIFDSTRRFVVLKNLKVETPACEAGGFFEDSVLRVTYVPFRRESNVNENVGQMKSEDEPLFKDETDYFGYENSNSKSSSSERSSDETEISREPEKRHNVMAFICKLTERAGALNLEKCVERGVRPGPLLGRLKHGFDVKLPDGSVVKADDVRNPPQPGSVFIFVDVPDESYLPALIKSEAFKPHQKNTLKEDDVALVVVHFSSEEMMENPVYKQWMDEFSPSTKHWFINERNEFSGYFASHRIQRQLNELDNDVFPMLKEAHPYLTNKLEADPTEENPAKRFKIDVEGANVEEPVNDKFKEHQEMRISNAFHIRPAKGFEHTIENSLNPDKTSKETIVTPEVQELISAFKLQMKTNGVTRSSAERDQEFPRIITLGTGSSIPNKTRNVSANLIRITSDNCTLLDCGEGTLGQIVRFYGHNGADEILKNLRMIYISHLHADHHMGLIEILNRRRKVSSEKVLILAPIQIKAWLDFFNFRIQEINSTFDLFSCADLLNWRFHDMANLIKRVGLVKLDTCYVKHCPHSFGISLEMKNSMQGERFPSETVKITYSGDTLPCSALVDIGMNSDVLIHEATMADNLEKEAKYKMHSTISQAIDIGKQMKANFVILTHFSQRYDKIPMMNSNVENVAIAFDNMEVTLNDFPMMHLMYEPLKAMFCENVEMMEDKALKRKNREERQIEFTRRIGNQSQR